MPRAQTRQSRLPALPRLGVAVLGLMVLGLMAMGPALGCRAPDRSKPGSRLSPEIEELSGLVASSRAPGHLWAHGDSGTEPVLFAVDGAARITARVRLAGVENIDWEDIATDGRRIFVGDTGNNLQARQDQSIYILPEPDPVAGDQQLRPELRVPFRYPDQSGVPAVPPNFDAEALFWADGHLHLLSKHRADTRTTLYRFESLDPAGTTLTKISEFDVGGGDLKYGGRVTAADVDSSGERLAVLTYHALFVFAIDTAKPNLLADLRARIDFDMEALQQCEAVAWTESGLVIANENGQLFRLGASELVDGGRFPARTR